MKLLFLQGKMYRNNTGEPQSLSNSNHMLGAPSVNNDLQVLTERPTGTPGLGALGTPATLVNYTIWGEMLFQ